MKFFKNIKKAFMQTGLIARLTLAAAALVSLTVAISAVVMIRSSSDSILRKNMVINEQAYNSLYEFVNGQYSYADSMHMQIHSDKELRNIINDLAHGYTDKPSNRDSLTIKNILINMLYSNDKLRSVLLVPAGRDFAFCDSRKGSNTIIPSYPYTQLDCILEAQAADSYITAAYSDELPYDRNSSSPAITFVVKIRDIERKDMPVIGYLLLNYDYETFLKTYNIVGQFVPSAVCMTNQSDSVIFSNEASLLGTFLSEDPVPEDVIFLSGSVGDTMGVYSSVTKKALDADGQALIQKILVILIISLVAILLIIFFANFYYGRCINTLANALESSADADFKNRLPDGRNDEVGRLNHLFNEMCDRINSYAAESYEAGEARGVAERNALQAQINPHFLFNTIDSIRASALENNDYNTAEMLDKLGYLFHWITDFDEPIVSLGDELEYVSDYVSLQQLRFNDRFEYNTYADDYLVTCGIPKLTLQPIVENAINHTREAMRSRIIHISIRVNPTKDGMAIIVEDDGDGIPKDKLMKLDEHVMGRNNYKEYGIALRNIHQRITGMFGKQYGIDIKSTEGEGTRVYVWLPSMTLEEMQKHV